MFYKLWGYWTESYRILRQCIEKLSSINLLKSTLRYFSPFRNASVLTAWRTIINLRPSCSTVLTLYLIKLRRYWTDSYQIFKRPRRIIAAINIAFPIKNSQCATLMKNQSSNPRYTRVKNCNFLDEMAKIGISHQISQQLLDWSSPTCQHWYTHILELLNWRKFRVIASTSRKKLTHIALSATFVELAK